MFNIKMYSTEDIIPYGHTACIHSYIDNVYTAPHLYFIYYCKIIRDKWGK